MVCSTCIPSKCRPSIGGCTGAAPSTAAIATVAAGVSWWDFAGERQRELGQHQRHGCAGRRGRRATSDSNRNARAADHQGGDDRGGGWSRVGQGRAAHGRAGHAVSCFGFGASGHSDRAALPALSATDAGADEPLIDMSERYERHVEAARNVHMLVAATYRCDVPRSDVAYWCYGIANDPWARLGRGGTRHGRTGVHGTRRRSRRRRPRAAAAAAAAPPPDPTKGPLRPTGALGGWRGPTGDPPSPWLHPPGRTPPTDRGP